MPKPSPESPEGHDTASRFQTTHWSVVVKVRDRASPEADEALATLCQTYWYPLYVYIRGRSDSAAQAEELTQEFFSYLLAREFLAAADSEKGKFRAFLLTCCKHFLANEHERARAGKRGSGRPALSLDFEAAGERYRREPAHGETAERSFDRRWALTLLDQVLEQLGREYDARGQGKLFEGLKLVLTSSPEALPHAQIGQPLGMTEGAVKKAAQRLRQRYREILCEHIAATVASPDEIEHEIRQLFSVLSV